MLIHRKNMEVKLGKYQHYKGNFYEVIGVAKHSETEEDLVVYRARYGEHERFGTCGIYFDQFFSCGNI